MVHDSPTAALSVEVLYGILRLRAEVFVVEQAAAYLDPDGRDLEPSTRQLWVADDAGAVNAVVATARILDDGTWRRIGRIATAPAWRGRGLGGQLVDHFLTTAAGPWRLDGQTYLVDWYRGFGFEVDGPEYTDGDGIAHVPMVRPLAEAG